MDLIDREEILRLMEIGPGQFKSYRRLGLVSGHVKRKSIIKRVEKGEITISKPSGFTYLYPRKVLTQIKWIREQHEKGKNLTEIQTEFVRKKIREEESFKLQAGSYVKTLSLSSPGDEETSLDRKCIGAAIEELSRKIRQDHPDRKIRTLTFRIEPQNSPLPGTYQKTVKVALDLENSQF
jgi:hypothetical protein